jgi:hypothetical protein
MSETVNSTKRVEGNREPLRDYERLQRMRSRAAAQWGVSAGWHQRLRA